MTYLITSSLLAVSLAASTYATPLSTNPHSSPSGRGFLAKAPVIQTEEYHGRINNSYIIVLKHDSPSRIVDNHMNFLQSAHYADALDAEESGLTQVYSGDHIKGYAGRFTESVIEQIRDRPEVEYVEPDQVVKISELKTQKGAPWGLARVSHRKKLTFGTFTSYVHDPKGGEGVDVYVIDTGINVKHVEFEGRAFWGKTIPQNDVDEDGNGHGTHCAGTIASRAYGVAKSANVIAVKVLGSNGSGSMSDVVAGVDWASTSAKAKMQAAQEEFRKTGKTAHKGSVANMSLGGGKSPTLDRVVNSAADNGLHFAVAAGNENRDACQSSPAAAEKAVTVGASNLRDAKAYFSNHGSCVDIFAPGENIKSTWNSGNHSSNTISGTSMASPHTAGVIAYLLSLYPSEKFNPVFPEDFSVDLNAQRTFSATSLYSIAHAALPRFISGFLPDPSLFEANNAPVPKPMPAALMKKALLSLGTPDMLSDLPEKTINLLLFNNATEA
ncbi:serine-type endopeptidase [Moniliophthora roreri MCA 2997]|uniref:Serine-type endopeptidase n=1 Tax=Moniliophthora roreri (strain MCA 2997) TaxID=1381753 RepID=V2XU09_MONRO|nr:serine-type endopeptidase [Moniliophthora roreri MCA 2997]